MEGILLIQWALNPINISSIVLMAYSLVWDAKDWKTFVI